MASSEPKLKRPCYTSSLPSHPNDDIMISSSSSMLGGGSDQTYHLLLLESFLRLPESSDSLIGQSFDRLLESRACDSEKTDMIDRALKLGSVILEAAKRSTRKRDSMHNAVVWPLPLELTVKVFSFLDTQSLSYAAAACSSFHKCASDPVCYTHVDLVTVRPIVNNTVVSTMVQRAGKSLQSLKLGLVPGQTSLTGLPRAFDFFLGNSSGTTGMPYIDKQTRQGKESSILTRSCLACLSANDGTPGALLRRLHLHKIESMDNTDLGAALSSCPSLLDFEISGFSNIRVELGQTLESIIKYCPLIERLCIDSSKWPKSGRDDSLKLLTCNGLVKSCPNLSYLSLRGFRLLDKNAHVLVKGLRNLKFVDFSTSYAISGTFLKNLGGNAGGGLIEVLILRNCVHLKQVEVSRLFTCLLSGDFKHLRLLDISIREGPAYGNHWLRRCSSSFIPLEVLAERKPNLHILAEISAQGRKVESNDTSEESQTSSGYMSDSSYSSDPSSGSSSSSSSGDSEESSGE